MMIKMHKKLSQSCSDLPIMGIYRTTDIPNSELQTNGILQTTGIPKCSVTQKYDQLKNGIEITTDDDSVAVSCEANMDLQPARQTGLQRCDRENRDENIYVLGHFITVYGKHGHYTVAYTNEGKSETFPRLLDDQMTCDIPADVPDCHNVDIDIDNHIVHREPLIPKIPDSDDEVADKEDTRRDGDCETLPLAEQGSTQPLETLNSDRGHSVDINIDPENTNHIEQHSARISAASCKLITQMSLCLAVSVACVFCVTVLLYVYPIYRNSVERYAEQLTAHQSTSTSMFNPSLSSSSSKTKANITGNLQHESIVSSNSDSSGGLHIPKVPNFQVAVPRHGTIKKIDHNDTHTKIYITTLDKYKIIPNKLPFVS